MNRTVRRANIGLHASRHFPTVCGKGSPYAHDKARMLALLDDIPPQRPQAAPALDDPAAGEWWVLHSKSNLEWRLARDLLRLGLDYYLPQCEAMTRTADQRRTVSVLPLFKNYLFLRGDEFAPGKAYQTLKLRNVIRVANQKRLRDELLNLSKAIAVNPRIEPCDFAVKGRKVRIVSGAFEGIEGVVIRRGKCDVLVIGVEGCGQAAVELLEVAEIEIPASKLEAA